MKLNVFKLRLLICKDRTRVFLPKFDINSFPGTLCCWEQMLSVGPEILLSAPATRFLVICSELIHYWVAGYRQDIFSDMATNITERDYSAVPTL
jgi:hypothetical protein